MFTEVKLFFYYTIFSYWLSWGKKKRKCTFLLDSFYLQLINNLNVKMKKEGTEGDTQMLYSQPNGECIQPSERSIVGVCHV